MSRMKQENKENVTVQPYEFSAAYAYKSKLSPAYAVENSHG
jgi:hypothetical protein